MRVLLSYYHLAEMVLTVGLTALAILPAVLLLLFNESPIMFKLSHNSLEIFFIEDD